MYIKEGDLPCPSSICYIATSIVFEFFRPLPIIESNWLKILIERQEQHFSQITVFEFWSKFLARHAQRHLCVAHIASDFTYVYCTAVGTIFGTTDVYELGFSLIKSTTAFVYNLKEIEKLTFSICWSNKKMNAAFSPVNLYGLVRFTCIA